MIKAKIQKLLMIILDVIRKFLKVVIINNLYQNHRIDENIILIAIAKRTSKPQARNLYYKHKSKFETVFEEFLPLKRGQEKDVMNLLIKISQINLGIEI